jgi:hypothetical protein
MWHVKNVSACSLPVIPDTDCLLASSILLAPRLQTAIQLTRQCNIAPIFPRIAAPEVQNHNAVRCDEVYEHEEATRNWARSN